MLQHEIVETDHDYKNAIIQLLLLDYKLENIIVWLIRTPEIWLDVIQTIIQGENSLVYQIFEINNPNKYILDSLNRYMLYEANILSQLKKNVDTLLVSQIEAEQILLNEMIETQEQILNSYNNFRKRLQASPLKYYITRAHIIWSVAKIKIKFLAATRSLELTQSIIIVEYGANSFLSLEQFQLWS